MAFSSTYSRFLGTFLAHFLISRPLFRFFSRVENTVSQAQFWDYSQVGRRFLGHNFEISLGQNYFFSGTLIFHCRLYGVNPHPPAKTPRRIFQKYPRGDGIFSEYINQCPHQGQIKMNNTREESPTFIKICNPNSRLGESQKNKAKNSRRTAFCIWNWKYQYF